jgi:hypothetical protein
MINSNFLDLPLVYGYPSQSIVDSTSLEKQIQNEQEVVAQPLIVLGQNSSEIENSSRCIATNKSLFSTEELENIEIGYAIIQDRIQLKENLLSKLLDDDISLEVRAEWCQLELGGGICPELIFNETPLKGKILDFCEYTSHVLNKYKLAERVFKLFISAPTQLEKNKYQNDLYYFLSFEKKHFREWMSCLSFQIPEHSIEDNFFEMICLKLCGTATKEYDILNEYLKLSLTGHGTKTQIDNQKLLDHYKLIHVKLIENFKTGCPFFWLGEIDNIDIKKIFAKRLEEVNFNISKFAKEVLEITSELDEKIYLFEEDVSNELNRNVKIYNHFGELVLNAIKKYELVSKKIKEIENNTVKWLSELKEKQLFRKLSNDQKTIIRRYLEDKKKMENEIALEEIKKARKADSLINEQNRLKKEQNRVNFSVQRENPPQIEREKKNNQNLKKNPISIITSPSISLDIKPQEVLAETPSTQPVVIHEEPREEPIVQPKVKIKRRPNLEPAPIENTSLQETLLKAAPTTLPDSFNKPELISLIDELKNETKQNKLKKLFNELNDFGVFAENIEKNNKGYFCVKSPTTGIIHVRTYHHLHNTENHYASLFMAVRQVLIAADIF